MINWHQMSSEAYVYLMRFAGDDGIYKVGVSVDPEGRRRTMERAWEHPVELLAAKKTPEPYRVEACIHRELAAHAITSDATLGDGATEMFHLTAAAALEVAEFLGPIASPPCGTSRRGNPEFQQISAYIPKDLYRKLKIRALESGKDLSEAVEDALRSHLKM